MIYKKTSAPIVKDEKLIINGKFVKGPIPWSWLEKAAHVDSMALSTAWIIWFYYGVTGKRIFKFSNAHLETFNISRQAKSRVLKKLEAAGLIKITKAVGRSPIVEIVMDVV
jgi:hypothetical protein